MSFDSTLGRKKNGVHLPLFFLQHRCINSITLLNRFHPLSSPSLASVAIYPLSHFFSLMPHTLSIHFISHQFSAPFLLFLACRSCRCHQVFCRRGKEKAKRSQVEVSHEVTDDTQERASILYKSAWQSQVVWFLKSMNIFEAYLSVTLVIPLRQFDGCHEGWRRHSSNESHTWACHMLLIHTQHLQEVQFVLVAMAFSPHDDLNICHRVKLCVTPPVWIRHLLFA